uniref:histidine kinase dimerization/phosphoacceptor domain -containing protein n=1 Tax=Mariniflexile sp. TaxID=1979402 RepID=UPI004047F0B7
MKRKSSLFLVLVINFAFGQNDTDMLLNQSKTYQNKALWFNFMPQYNQDSSRYYFNKAIHGLNENKIDHLEQLGNIYMDMIIYSTSNDQLELNAQTGWKFVSKLPDAVDRYRILKFDYLALWAILIKIDVIGQKESLELFTKALDYLKSKENKDVQARISMYKGVFHYKYGIKDELEMAHQYLLKSYNYYKTHPSNKNNWHFFTTNLFLTSFHTDKNNDSVSYYVANLKSIVKDYPTPYAYSWYYSKVGRELITYPQTGKDSISPAQYAEGKSNIMKSIEIIETYNKDTSIYPYCFGLLADLNLNDKKYDSAIAYYKKSREFHLEHKNAKPAIDILLYIGKAYEKKGDLINALKYKEQFYSELLDFERETNERSLRENELKADLSKQNEELGQKHLQQQLFIVALIIGSLLLGLVYRNYRLKRKSGFELEKTNNELKDKNNLLDIRNAENELLLKEIHHRVKNNLELVKSLIALQSAQLEDSATKDAMIASQNRVQSMGIIHQKLYQGENLGSIEMKDYFLNLGEGILDTFNADDKVKIECAMDRLELDVDTAVPIGLIVNELLTNALKYAFPENASGNILISLSKSNPETLTLKVVDNGIGKTAGLAPKGTGFGSQLIKLLTQQLNGEMTEENQNGTSVLFHFKLNTAA